MKSSSQAPHFLRALQQRKSFTARTQTLQLTHHYPSDSCLLVRMRGETWCLVFLHDTEFYMMRSDLVCVGTGPTKHTENAVSAPRLRHKDDVSASLLSVLIWPWRIPHVTLLLQWEGITNVGKTSRVLFMLVLTPRQHKRLSSISSLYNIPPHCWWSNYSQQTTSRRSIALGLVSFGNKKTNLFME